MRPKNLDPYFDSMISNFDTRLQIYKDLYTRPDIDLPGAQLQAQLPTTMATFHLLLRQARIGNELRHIRFLPSMIADSPPNLGDSFSFIHSLLTSTLTADNKCSASWETLHDCLSWSFCDIGLTFGFPQLP